MFNACTACKFKVINLSSELHFLVVYFQWYSAKGLKRLRLPSKYFLHFQLNLVDPIESCQLYRMLSFQKKKIRKKNLSKNKSKPSKKCNIKFGVSKTCKLTVDFQPANYTIFKLTDSYNYSRVSPWIVEFFHEYLTLLAWFFFLF